MAMTKKAIIEKLRSMGFKAYAKNTLVTMIEKGYVIVIEKGAVLHKVSVAELES